MQYPKNLSMNIIQIKSVYCLIEQTITSKRTIFRSDLLLGNFTYFGWELFSNINDQVMNYLSYINISLEDKIYFTLYFQGIIATSNIINELGNDS